MVFAVSESLFNDRNSVPYMLFQAVTAVRREAL